MYYRPATLLAVILLSLQISMAQSDPTAGVTPFSTQLGGVYDVVDAATSRVLVTIPVRDKDGKMPFPFKLVGNYHAYSPAKSWYMSTGIFGVPLAADLGVFAPISCPNGYCLLADATGATHPYNSSPPANTLDGSGYYLGTPTNGGYAIPI